MNKIQFSKAEMHIFKKIFKIRRTCMCNMNDIVCISNINPKITKELLTKWKDNYEYLNKIINS